MSVYGGVEPPEHPARQRTTDEDQLRLERRDRVWVLLVRAPATVLVGVAGALVLLDVLASR